MSLPEAVSLAVNDWESIGYADRRSASEPVEQTLSKQLESRCSVVERTPAKRGFGWLMYKGKGYLDSR